MRRRFVYTCVFLLIFAGVFIVFFRNNYVFSESGAEPNVIFIILDAARPDRFSCYGYNENTTPFIDEIRRDSRVFGLTFIGTWPILMFMWPAWMMVSRV